MIKSIIRKLKKKFAKGSVTVACQSTFVKSFVECKNSWTPIDHEN